LIDCLTVGGATSEGASTAWAGAGAISS